MRSFFLLLIIAWITGMSAGVAAAPWWGVVLLAAALAGLAHAARQPLPILVAAALVAAVGALAVPPPRAPAACTISVPAPVTIRAQAGSTEQSRRYVAAADDECLVMLTVAPFPRLQPGDAVVVTGKPPEPVSVLASEYPEYARYLTQQGIAATWYFPQVTVVQSDPPPLQPVRSAAAAHINRLFPEPTAGLVAAMLLNETTGLSEQIVTTFRATGLSHIIAISGSNVSLLTGLALLALLALPLKPRLRTFTLISGLWIYIGLIGAPVSAVRAAFFWTMALIAYRLHRLVSLPTVFFLTAAVMVSFQPQMLRDVGFQLSMAAVGGIFLVLFLRRRIRGDNLTGVAFILNAALVTIGATLATAPISAYHFGTFAPVGLLANLLVVPLMSGFLILSVAAVLLGLVFPLGGAIVASGVHLIVRLTISIADTLARIPGGYLEDIALPWWALVLYYGAIAAAAHLWLRYQGRSWREVWQ